MEATKASLEMVLQTATMQEISPRNHISIGSNKTLEKVTEP